MNYFSLNTNVKELRIGDNSSKGIDKEIGKYIVFTMKIPWDVLKKNLTKTPEKIIFVESVEKDIIDNEIDIMIIGSDWEGKRVVGEKLVKKLVFFDRIGEHSTTRILENEIRF